MESKQHKKTRLVLIENGEWYGEPIEESNVEDNERNNYAKT